LRRRINSILKEPKSIISIRLLPVDNFNKEEYNRGKWDIGEIGKEQEQEWSSAMEV